MTQFAKPCIVCGAALDNVFQDVENQPHAGTAFTTHGHYGSTVFDPLDGQYLEINICDPCMLAKAKEGVILAGRDKRPILLKNSVIGWTKADWELVEWDPNLPKADDSINIESWEEFQSIRNDHAIETQWADFQIKKFFEEAEEFKKA